MAQDESTRREESRPHISFSQINLYASCGEAYRRRYIEGEIIPPGVAAIRGRSVHKAAEVNHRQKLETGEDLPLSDLEDVAATTFDAEKENGYVLTPEEESEGAAQVLGRTKDRSVLLTGVYAEHVAPDIEPELVEEAIRVELPSAPADLLQVLDVTTVDRRIKDLKTANKSKRQADADDSLQLTLYDLAYRLKTGQGATGLDLEVLVDTKTPKHQRLSTTRDRPDYEVLIARVNNFFRARDAGIFPPAELGHWRCSARWCGFYFSCPYVNSERRAAAVEESN